MAHCDCYRHDFNDELGGNSFVKSKPEWQTGSIMTEWESYAAEELGEFVVRTSPVSHSSAIGIGIFRFSDVGKSGDGDNNEDGGKKKGKKKPQVYIDEEGVPRLPVFEGLERPNLEDMKSLIRDFLNAHYRMFIYYLPIENKV
jgi:hypothetical protein